MSDKPEAVLYVIDSLDSGGAERIVVDLVKNLNPHRFVPFVCVTRKPGVLAGELESDGIEINCLSRKSRYDIGGFIRLLKLIHRTKPRIIHTHLKGANLIGRTAGLIMRVPVVISHEHAMQDYSLLERFAYRVLAIKTKYMIVCDMAMKESLLEKVRLNGKKIVVIYNGIDLKKFQDNEFQEKQGSEDLPVLSGPIIGCCARLEARKDIGNLLEAASLVLEQVRDARLFIIGEGPKRKELEQKASDMGIADNVCFLGYRKDIPALLRRIDLFVLPSISEGVPLSILEAMASMSPVIATNVGGIPEIIRDGYDGLLVPARSPKELASSIACLLNDVGKAKMIAENAYMTVSRYFSIERMVQQIEALYLSETQVSSKGLGGT